ncbi:MAG: 30S ribosomal protein S13 [Nanoarchaeota archaeon]
MQETTKEVKKKPFEKEESVETLVRIMGQDIGGSKSVYVGLTRIKGVSWAISNALCLTLGLKHSIKIAELDKPMIKKIEDGLRSLPIPAYMKNRRSDRDTGDDLHLFTTNLDIKKEFDIKRLKQIKSYKGIRHSLGLPVRGQRTRSHFRAKAKTGVRRKNDKKA